MALELPEHGQKNIDTMTQDELVRHVGDLRKICGLLLMKFNEYQANQQLPQEALHRLIACEQAADSVSTYAQLVIEHKRKLEDLTFRIIELERRIR